LPQSECGCRSRVLSIKFSVTRQHNAKGTPGAGFAVHPDFPSVGAHYKIHDAQPQAAAPRLTRQTLVYLVEPAKYSLLIARGDANAIVFYREHNVAGLVIRPHRHTAIGGRVLIRVVEK